MTNYLVTQEAAYYYVTDSVTDSVNLSSTASCTETPANCCHWV